MTQKKQLFFTHIAKPLLTIVIPINFKLFSLHPKCHYPIFSKTYKKLERRNWYKELWQDSREKGI